MASTCFSIVAKVARSDGLAEFVPSAEAVDVDLDVGAIEALDGGPVVTDDPQAEATMANPSSRPTSDRRWRRDLIWAFWHDRIA